MTKLEKMITKLPKICIDYDLGEDKLIYNQPKTRIYNYEGKDVIDISDEERGNLSCFVYYNETVVDIKKELKEWADKYNKYWECRYEGTFVLLDK